MAEIISLELITDRAGELYDEALNDSWQEVQDAKKELLSGNVNDRTLGRYDRAVYQNDKIANYDFRKYVDGIRQAYEIFKSMARDLSYELGATVTDDVISFKWCGKTLSFITKMIAATYNLHPGMFGFESSFSEHEAYSEAGHLFKIGIARNDDDTVVIKANLLPRQNMFR